VSYVNNLFTKILIITDLPFDILYSDTLSSQLNKYIKSCIIFILTFDSLTSDHLITALNKLHIRNIFTILIMSLVTLLFYSLTASLFRPRVLPYIYVPGHMVAGW
jgi:hypothetical protein